MASNKDWTAGKWELSAPETYALLYAVEENGASFVFSGSPVPRSYELFKLSLLEVIARRVLRIAKADRGVLPEGLADWAYVQDESTILAPGSRWGVPLSRPLAWWVEWFEAFRKSMEERNAVVSATGVRGVPLAYFMMFARNTWGSWADRFHEGEVLPLLVDRGLFTPYEGRLLFFFEHTRYRLTPKGKRLKTSLVASLEQALRDFRKWVDNDPARAQRFLTDAGSAVLLMDSIRSDATRLGKAHAPTTSGRPGEIKTVVFSPDGGLLAHAGEDGEIRVTDMHTRKKLWSLSGHEGSVHSLAFHPDGDLLASGGADKEVRMWSIRTGELVLVSAGHSGEIEAVAYGPDGQILAIAGAYSVSLRKARGKKLLGTIKSNTKINVLAFDPNGRLLACGNTDTTVSVWHAQTREKLQSLVGHSKTVLSVTFHPDGRLLASGGADKTIRVWDTHSGKLLHTIAHGAEVNSVAFSPDGRLLASGGDDGYVKLWQVRDGKALCTPLTSRSRHVRTIAFDPRRRRLISGGSGGILEIFSAAPSAQIKAKSAASQRG